MPGEMRFQSRRDVRVEARGEGALPQIAGYASVFYNPADPGTEYQLFSDLFERIMPGAFDRAIREDDVRALLNHDSDHVLGRTVAKTLTLSVDAIGLHYLINPPDTQLARDLVESIRRGDITGSSFAFRVDRQSWIDERRADGVMVTIRQIEAVTLYDVGPVTFPAYDSATSGVRALGDSQARQELDGWRESQRKAAEEAHRRAMAPINANVRYLECLAKT